MGNKLKNFKFEDICSLSCIFAIFINKVIIVYEPGFYFGKFNIFQSVNFGLSDLIIITFSLLFICNSYRHKTKIKINLEITLILLLLFLTSFKLSFITAILFSIIIFNSSHSKNIKYFLYTVYFQITIALFQFLFQTNTKIPILNFLGEPNLNIETKGISKIRLGSMELLRSYGTTAHPNILASIISIAFLLTKNIKTKTATLLALISTTSISSILSLFIANLTTFKLKKTHTFLLLTTIIVLTTIIGLRLSDNKFESIKFREHQTTQYLSEESSFKQLLFGKTELTAINGMLPWDIQPLHNSYLYLLSQHGILALIIFIYLLHKLFYANKNIAIFLITILLFDHFWFSLTNGILLFAFIYLVTLKSSKEVGTPG